MRHGQRFNLTCSACAENTTAHSFGLGVIWQGPWITGNKLYAGSVAIVGYPPSKRLAIAVVTSYQQAAFDSHGDVTDAGPAIMSAPGESPGACRTHPGLAQRSVRGTAHV